MIHVMRLEYLIPYKFYQILLLQKSTVQCFRNTYPYYKSWSWLSHQSAFTSAIWHWTGKQHQQNSFKTAWITSLIFTKTTTQACIVITSLHYKTYNSLYDVIVSLMLKLNCFKETKLYLPIIVLFFFIVFCMLTDFFNCKENHKVLANVNKMRKR